MASRNRPTPREQSRRKTESSKRRRPTHDTKTYVRAKRKRRHAGSTRDGTDASSTSCKRRREDREASPGDMGYSDRYRRDPRDCYRPRGRSRSVVDHYSSWGRQDSSSHAREHSTHQPNSPKESPTETRLTTSRREPFILAFPEHVDRYVPAPLPSPDDPPPERHTDGRREPFLLAFPAHVDRYVPSPLPSPVSSRDDEMRIGRRARADSRAGDGGAGRWGGRVTRLEGDATGVEEDTSIPSSERHSADPEWEAEVGRSSAAGDSSKSWDYDWGEDTVVSPTENVEAERPRDRLVIEDIPILDDEVW